MSLYSLPALADIRDKLLQIFWSNPGHIVIFSSSFLLIIILLIWLFNTAVIVQCWFCGLRSRVRRKFRNSFTCSHCQQYNGFAKNGDYNRVIKAQHSYSTLTYQQPQKPFLSHSDVLCGDCSTKQSIITERMSEFSPVGHKSSSWHKEAKQFRVKLEQLYPLCVDCRMRVNSTIAEVDRELMPALLNWWCNKRGKTSTRRENSSVNRVVKSPTYFLLRLLAILDMSPLLLSPLIARLTSRLCLVRHSTPSGNLSISDRLTSLFYHHLTRHNINCPTLVSVNDFLATWINSSYHLPSCLLAILLQTFFIITFIRSRSHRFISTFLIDLLMLLLMTNHLLPYLKLSTLITIDSQSPSTLVTLAGLCAMTVLITAFASYALYAWLSFCRTDLTYQHRALSDFNFPNRPDQSSDRVRLPSQLSSHSTNRRQSGVFSWPPPSRNSPTITSADRSQGHSSSRLSSTFSRACSVSTNQRPSLSPLSADKTSYCCPTDLVDSISVKSNRPHSLTPSSGRRNRPRRRLPQQRRPVGLIRFVLTLLFGRLESWQDVKGELTSLFNALLIAAVVYTVSRVLIQLVGF